CTRIAFGDQQMEKWFDVW
nr:immunoglobulin heavy chain junction region [Macaca mulatta]MOW22603.1 immunoglobulin heavy chain junction region [Macaca mulatta]MOW22613.1 immunoglobulin heavy chain junction region [Macaca mulatta]MOW22617.1 immunoglobulin heavy chain junction region [Macaca mulatta]MOW22624.1 immunoglobulin heavy chain junction region [Macaca mulatta]